MGARLGKLVRPKLAEEKKMKSIAIPAVGAGAGAFPMDLCVDVLFEIVGEHIKGETSLETVVYILYEEKFLETFQEKFKKEFPETALDPLPSPMPRAYPAGAPSDHPE